MIAVQIAHIIADYVVFLNMTDDDELDPDVAVKMMEALAGQLEDLDRSFLRELIDALAIVADQYSGEARQVVQDIPYSFYLEEVLAADDPERLAELEALREARE